MKRLTIEQTNFLEMVRARIEKHLTFNYESCYDICDDILRKGGYTDIEAGKLNAIGDYWKDVILKQ